MAPALQTDALFVYGSLSDAAFLTRLLKRAVIGTPAKLAGYERRRARYHYIVPRAGAVTEGLLLSGLSDADFKALDGYEEVGRLYTREAAEVKTAAGQAVRCWVYMPTAAAMEGAP